jgi:hypothetical protein
LLSVNRQSLDPRVNSDADNNFTQVPVDEALQVIRNKLHRHDILEERAVLQVEVIVGMLEICLCAIYFQRNVNFFQQEDDMAMGSFLSATVTNIYMEHFEKAPDWTEHKPSLWLRHSDGTFTIRPHGPGVVIECSQQP